MKTCWEFGCRLRAAMIDAGLACLLLSAAACDAGALPDAWSVDVRQHAAVDRTYKQGESVDMTVTLRSGFAPLDLTGARAVFYWYTNSAQNVWWTNAAAVASARGGTVSVRWTPAMDVGAPDYPYWIGVWTAGATSPVWRVNGTVRMLPSPGFTPNAVVPPVRTLDFAGISVTNAPWVSADLWNSGSNALAEAVQSAYEIASGAAAQAESNRQAIASLPAPSTDALRLVNPAGTEWRDATGAVWRVTFSVITNVSCTLSDPFGKVSQRDMYDRPSESVYVSEPNTQLDVDPYPWTINFDANNEGLWNVFNYDLGIYWAASGYDLPLVAVSGNNETGTATFDYSYQVVAVTNQVDTVVLASQLSVLKEIHADSYTNLIWRTVWSNGWMTQIAYTNTP